MGYVARLRQGTRVLDLSSGRYQLYGDFLPPTTATAPNIAAGTSANRRGGGVKVGDRAQNREWAFMVRALGASTAEADRAIQDVDYFLQLAGDEAEPLYFEWLDNDDVGFQPLWGQTGVYRRLEVVHGSAHHAGPYFVKDIRSRAQIGQVELTIKPYALGSRQRVGSAAGGVLEDVIGTVDGRSRGVIVPEAITNKFTNPVFGHATWNNDWTAGANLSATQNTDAAYVLFETSSAKLVARNTSNVTFSQTLAAGNTNAHVLSFYARKSDGSAVSVADIQVNYNGLQTSSYTAVGNGWYRVAASVTGVVAGVASGLTLLATGVVLYVDGFQLEELAYATPLAYGGLLGCAWTGTAHASTSTRTAAVLTLPAADTFGVAGGSLRLAWRPDRAHDAEAGVRTLFQDDDAGGALFKLWFDGSDDKWRFTDGTNTVASNADTFAAYTTIVFHAIWGQARLELYKNGSAIATGVTYTPPTAPTKVYLGRNGVPSGQYAEGTFSGATFYDRMLSAAEILTDYNNIGQIAANGERVDWIPWLWTKDGDNILDGCDDSTYDNWAVINGIAGSVAADTEWIISSLSVSNKAHYWLLTRDYPIGEFCVPNSNLYFDLSGVVDANASGGEYQNFTIATTIQQGGGHKTIAGDTKFFLRAKQASASTFDCDVGYRFASGGNSFMTGDYVTLTCATSYRFFYVGQINVTWPSYHPRRNRVIELDYDLQALGANIHLDYLLVWPGNVTHLVTTTGTPNKYWIQGQIANGVTTADVMYNSCGLVGNLAELVPERENQMLFVAGGPGEANTITDTATFTVYVTSRWSLT